MPKTTKRQRCTEKVRALSVRNVGGLMVPQDATGDSEAATDRWAIIRDTVAHRLVGCERWLLDAAQRWLLSRARSPDTIRAYGARFGRWVQASDRRSLTDQMATRSE